MPATRRTNGASASTSYSSATNANTTSTTAQAMHSPYRPTASELAFFSIYPLTLVLGSAFSHLSPTLYPPFNASTYSTVAQSFQPAEHAPSYFAQKRNIFNVYFVKYGWFWCSFALLIFTASASRGRASARKSQRVQEDETARRRNRDNRLRRLYQTALRYILATTFWVLTTQWAFGPPLVDRGFKLTGGACELAAHNIADPQVGGKTEVASVLTHAACNMAGGIWLGGYDISGHVFILVLGSGMLWMEMLPFLLPLRDGFGAGRVVRGSDGRVGRIAQGDTDAATAGSPPDAVKAVHDSAAKELAKQERDLGPRSRTTLATLRTYATTMALATAGLSWWMLLMTAAFFHTWFEKLTGGVLAFATLWIVYVAPRGIPALREALGMPGV